MDEQFASSCAGTACVCQLASQSWRCRWQHGHLLHELAELPAAWVAVTHVLSWRHHRADTLSICALSRAVDLPTFFGTRVQRLRNRPKRYANTLSGRFCRSLFDFAAFADTSATLCCQRVSTAKRVQPPPLNIYKAIQSSHTSLSRVDEEKRCFIHFRIGISCAHSVNAI